MYVLYKWRKPICLLLIFALTFTPILSSSVQAVVAPQATSHAVASNSSGDKCITNRDVRPAFIDEEAAARYKARFLESNEFVQFDTTLQEKYSGKFKVELSTLKIVKLYAPHTSMVGVVVAVDGGAGSSSFSAWFDASDHLTMTIASIFELLPDGNTVEASIAMNGKPYVHAFVTLTGELLSGTIWHEGKTILLTPTTITAPQDLIGFVQCIWDCLSSYVPVWYLLIVFAVCEAVCIFYTPVCYWCFYTRLGAYLPRFIECWGICAPKMVYLPVIATRP